MKVLLFINYVFNLIYPNVCGICDKIYKKDLCPKCNLKLENIKKIKIDKYKNKYFKEHLYIFKYEGIIKEKLIQYKFNEKAYIYKAFANFILKNKKICGFLKNYDIIMPVPIHNNRKLQRGYNQSELLAKEIAKKFKNITYENDILIKNINTKPQSSKNKLERYKNVIGVYRAKNIHKMEGKRILILDDIYTTGATLNECAKTLKLACNTIKALDVITIAKD